MSFTLPDTGSPTLEFERPADRYHLERTAAAFTRRGFQARVAANAGDARRLVLEAIPAGVEVHIALCETMRELGVTAELDRQTQARERRKLGTAPDYHWDRSRVR